MFAQSYMYDYTITLMKMKKNIISFLRIEWSLFVIRFLNVINVLLGISLLSPLGRAHGPSFEKKIISLYPRIFNHNFGWIWPNGSGGEVFTKLSIYVLFSILFPLALEKLQNHQWLMEVIELVEVEGQGLHLNTF